MTPVPLWVTILISAASGALITGFFNWLIAARVKAHADDVQMKSSAIYKIKMDMAAAYFTATDKAQDVALSVLDKNSQLPSDEAIAQLRKCRDEIVRSFALAPIYFPHNVLAAFRENANPWSGWISIATGILDGSFADDGTQLEEARTQFSKGFDQSRTELIEQLKKELLPENHIKKHELEVKKMRKQILGSGLKGWIRLYRYRRFAKKRGIKTK